MALLSDDISVVLAGAAGQGIETVAGMLASILKDTGHHVFVTREFMSRIRGGTNSVQLRVASERVAAYVLRTDIAIPLDKSGLPHLDKYSRIGENTIIICEREALSNFRPIDPQRVNIIEFTEIAQDCGGRIYSNSVAAGVLAGLFNIDMDVGIGYLRRRFSSKGDEVVNNNIEAYSRGAHAGRELLAARRFRVNIERNPTVQNEIIFSGTDAVSLGAIAGGCNFVSSYPMSPSTGVLTFLSQHAHEFGIVIDQAEDEIAAINKALGAWYAGARAMVTTSDGGFSLMVEGLSLAGMIESPMVVHLGQRPGPATGLPTRTEQSGLKHFLNAGHGEFPRVIYAPGTLQDAFELTRRAFDVADEYQVPVCILTDQFLLDSAWNIPSPDLSNIHVKKHYVRTTEDYNRYSLTENGISPRGIPAYGEGLVVVDSDEHDEAGHLTEDLHLRTAMVEKRVRLKLDRLREDAIPPELVGPADYTQLVVTWGSNRYVVHEAIRELDRKQVAMLHFKQVYPLHKKTGEYLSRARLVAIAENNATAQFANVIMLETGHWIPVENRLLKYNGLPFSVEEIIQGLERVME